MVEQFTWKFSPSIVEQYFGRKDCEKAVLACGMSPIDRKKLGWEPDQMSTNTAAKAGGMWEVEALDILEQKGICVCKKELNINNGKLTEKETIGLLQQLQKTAENGGCEDTYLYQMYLNVNEMFVKEHMNYLNRGSLGKNVSDDGRQRMLYSEDVFCIQFGSCYPDLVWACWDDEQNKWVLSIVDCKLSKKPKLEHKLQVSLYTWILEAKLQEWIQGKQIMEDLFVVNKETAYIWNKGKEKETEFELAQVYPFTKNFMSVILPGILEKIRQAKDSEELNRFLCYTTGQKCEWCDNFSNCKKWCMEHEPMMLVPYESGYAQQFLRELSKESGAEDILQIEGFRNYFNTPDKEDLLRQNIFWKRFLNDKDVALNMLKKAIENPNPNFDLDGYEERKSASLEMPSFEKVQLVLTAQKDEATDRIYAYGIRATVWKDCLDVTNLSACLAQTNILEQSREGVELFVTQDIRADLPSPVKGSFSDITLLILVKERNKVFFDQAEDVFIALLHGILENVDAKNRVAVKWNDEISVQAYVMDNYEQKNIEEMLYEALVQRTTQQMKEWIYDLLFWLQGDSLVESVVVNNRPEETVCFPIVVLTSVLNRLYVFPSMVANSLHGVLSYLSKGTYARKEHYQAMNDSYFVNKLSNVLKNECINTYWDTKDAGELDKLNNHLQLRLEAESKIISAIRYVNSNVCHTNFKNAKMYTKPFRFMERSGNGDSLLGQLEFEAKYESMLQFVQNRAIRGMDIEQAIKEGKVIEAECTNVKKVSVFDNKGFQKKDRAGNLIYEFDCTYRVNNSDVVFDENKFSCIFCEKTNQNIAHVRTLIDVENRVFADSSCVVKGDYQISMPKSQSFEMIRENGCITISAKFAEAKDKSHKLLCWEPAEKGKTYLIFDYTNDFNTEKNIGSIKQVSSIANGQRFVEYLDKIEQFYCDIVKNYTNDEAQITELSSIAGHTFSESQKKAMVQLYKKNITLLLGPPGTGKTDFISRALVVLCELYRQRGKQLRVLVSANSHSAIENVLFAVEKKKTAAGTDLDIYKAERFDDGQKSAKGSIGVLDDKALQNLMNSDQSRPFVVGATVWTTHKWLSKKDGKYGREIPKNDFDVIVLDEASQVRLVDAIIPLSYSNKNTRLLIVGDENQLSPIILGNYDKDIEEPFRFGSVFRYLGDYSRFYNQSSQGGQFLDYQTGLTENFRMNEILVRYSEQEIYKSGYTSYNPAIATQTLQYQVKPMNYFQRTLFAAEVVEKNAPCTLQAILDEEYPLVLCIVKGKNQVEILEKEIQWIARITRTLENCMGATSQKDFWGSSTEDGMFGIIAPHHAHISHIKDVLAGDVHGGFKAPWTEKREDVYVGTVDKLQGKERQAVVVSYGVGDIEQAIGEGEFIYSRNRLNVSLTRGKQKNIVFLTEALLNFPIEALGIDNREILEGISFLCGFKNFMSQQEEDTSFDIQTFKSDIDDTEITIFRKKVQL